MVGSDPKKRCKVGRRALEFHECSELRELERSRLWGHPNEIQRGVQNPVYAFQAKPFLDQEPRERIIYIHHTPTVKKSNRLGDEGSRGGSFLGLDLAGADRLPPVRIGIGVGFGAASVVVGVLQSVCVSCAPIPYWSRRSDLAGAGDSNSRSVPFPVFGNAITSRIDGVLHRMVINLSNPVYRIAFGVRVCICRAFARCHFGGIHQMTRGIRVYAIIRSIVGDVVREIGKHEKIFSQ